MKTFFFKRKTQLTTLNQLFMRQCLIPHQNQKNSQIKSKNYQKNAFKRTNRKITETKVHLRKIEKKELLRRKSTSVQRFILVIAVR